MKKRRMLSYAYQERKKKLASETEQEKTKQQKTIIDMDDRSLEQSKGRARG